MAPFESVDAYIAAQPPATHAALACVRRAIRKALPKACETIAYNMPAYSLGRVRVLHFAAWKQHYALYVATDPIVAALKDKLESCTVEKGTIRFPLSMPVPERLIGRIARCAARQREKRESPAV